MSPHILSDQLIDHAPCDNLVAACRMNRNGCRPLVDCACEFHKCLNRQDLGRLKFGEGWVVCPSTRRRGDTRLLGVRKCQASVDKSALFTAHSSEVGHFKKSADHLAVGL